MYKMQKKEARIRFWGLHFRSCFNSSKRGQRNSMARSCGSIYISNVDNFVTYLYRWLLCIYRYYHNKVTGETQWERPVGMHFTWMLTSSLYNLIELGEAPLASGELY